MYEIYEPTLKIAGTSSRTFKDFTKENYDTFSRLSGFIETIDLSRKRVTAVNNSSSVPGKSLVDEKGNEMVFNTSVPEN